jgi:threonine aldolase
MSGLGGIHSRQLVEDPHTAQLSMDSIRDAYRLDDDDHHPKTQVVCLENTHNILGGVVLDQHYVDAVGELCRDELNIKLHIDGARFFNAATAATLHSHNNANATYMAKDMLRNVDSISLCLSKGLGAPLGSVLVGETEFIRLAKRARKRCGGGMRQAGVVAAMGLYALQHNVERLASDNLRAKRLANELERNGLILMRNGQVDSNLVFFALPPESAITKNDLCAKLLSEYNIQLGGGYSTTNSEGNNFFRAAIHMDISDEGIDRAAEAITALCKPRA